MKRGFVYIMTNKYNSVLYTGVTSNLAKRVHQHKNKTIEGFTKQYNIVKLVYYEAFDDIAEAIKKEKQIKGKTRQKKIDLINAFNPDWVDLYDDIAT
ncbi:MAG: GIY-YIG nuclease family protein [Desulfurella sp.]|jgi:putative endonuclease|uniref:GIY-YIG nuclease family protein n=1 Tax=Desulfurella sp. TaxID=1962857 RepID=UPI003D0F2076